MKVPRLATQSLNRWLERAQRPKAASLLACAAVLMAAFAGCQSQQTNPGDPFLPFMRTRVPAQGTNVPADSYYQGAPATSAPPASMPPPAAGPPAATPSSMRAAPGDKYTPSGVFSLPQSSIDRSKVTDPATGEVKAGGTAIARRSLAKPARGQSAVDTQLTAGKVTGAVAAAAAAGTVAATTDAKETPAGESLAAATPERAAADNSNDTATESSKEAGEEPLSDGAAVAFADTSEAADREGDADDAQHDDANHGEADPHAAIASADGQSWGKHVPEQTLMAGTSTLRILDTEDRRSDDRDSDAEDTASSEPGENHLTSRTVAANDAGDDAGVSFTGEEYAASTAGDVLSPSVTWNKSGEASPIGTMEPTGGTTTLAMAASPTAVVQTGWNESVSTAATPASAAGTTRPSGSTGRESQAFAYDPSYGWLRGRLEYTASQKQWKLRYIPIDGTTDQFGGSVVLADSAATQGLRAGDFVTAQGRVIGPSQPGRGFSPRYEVASIEPVAGSH